MRRITIYYWFSVFVLIESKTYVFNYDNFDKIFPLGARNGFNLHVYKNVDAKLKMKYVGPNIGGAFQAPTSYGVRSCSTSKVFEGYEANITISYYCSGYVHPTDTKLLSFFSPTCETDTEITLCYGSKSYDKWTYNRTIALKTCPEITR